MNKIRLSFSFVLISMLMHLFISSLNAQDLLKTLSKRHTAYKNSAPKERVLIISDRDIYAPGDFIWFNVTTYDIFSPLVSSQSTNIKIYLVNQDIEESISNNFTLQDGNANGILEIPSDSKEGVYSLRAETATSDKLHYSDKKIVVKKKILPPFIIKTTFPDKAFLPGDQFDLTIDFIDYYNEPLRNVEYVFDLFDGNLKISSSQGKVKKSGGTTVKISVPPKLNSGMLTYSISAIKKGDESILPAILPVTTDQIYINFYPEGGRLFDSIESIVNCYAYNASGSPLALNADVVEDGKIVNTIVTGTDGIGSFSIKPNSGKSYEVSINEPMSSTKTFKLPPIHTTGVALKRVAKDHDQVSYHLINAYNIPVTINIIGVSGGEVFWKSDHVINRNLHLDIDVSKAKGDLATMSVLNATGDVESEQVLMISRERNALAPNVTEEFSTSNRGKNELRIQYSKNKGIIVFSAVHSPWIIDELNHINIAAMSLPYDLKTQIIFRSRYFRSLDHSEDEIDRYLAYYIPYGFSWDKILNTRKPFHANVINDLVSSNLKFVDQLYGRYRVDRSDGMVAHLNMISAQPFATMNPKYAASLYKEKKDDIPYYKKMLAEGMPVMDVIQAIKPYNLQGNNMIFTGSAISISSQGGSLIVIDGISTGTDASVLRNISPYDVESIFISTKATDIQKYTSFNTVGLVEITLKDGTMSDNSGQKVEQKAEFDAPTYSDEKKGIPSDFRSTLYWKVLRINTDDSISDITYYNSDLYSKVDGSIYFISHDKGPFLKHLEYQVK